MPNYNPSGLNSPIYEKRAQLLDEWGEPLCRSNLTLKLPQSVHDSLKEKSKQGDWSLSDWMRRTLIEQAKRDGIISPTYPN